MSIEKSIEDFLVTEPDLAYGRTAIDQDELLIEGGLIDSLGILKLIAFLEEQYNLSFEEEDITAENFATINRIVDLVQKRGKSG